MIRLLQPNRFMPLFIAGSMLLAIVAFYTPTAFFQFGILLILLVVGTVVLLFPSVFLGLAVVSLVFSPENFIGHQVGGVEVQSLHKAIVLLGIAANIVRFGLSAQFNGPVAAIGIIFLLTLIFSNIHFRLTTYEMVKSLVGFVVPFAFISAVYRRSAIPKFILAIALMPLISVVLAIGTTVLGIWPVFNAEYTGAYRLQGLNIAAYLAYFAYIAMFVSVFEGIRSKSTFYLGLAAVHFGIIVLTGTRMPILVAGLFGMVVMLFCRNEFFQSRTKANIAILGGILFMLLLLLYWPQMEARLYGGVSSGFNLSGRAQIWEHFIAEIKRYPVFGQGIGTGKILVLDTGYLGSAAAHNEYLRLLVDVGVVGLTIYILGIGLWIGREFRFLRREERGVIAGFLLGFAVYSFTDNTLTAPPPLVAFFALSLFFLRARYEARDALSQYRYYARPVPA